MYGRRQSVDSAQRPLGKVDYARASSDANIAGDAYPQRNYPAGGAGKKPKSKWLTVGVPILIVAIIAGAVVGGIVGSRSADDSNDSSTSSSGTSGGGSIGGGAGGKAGTSAQSLLFTGYNAYGVPMYPENVASVYNQAPSFSNNDTLAWGDDPRAPAAGAATNVRQDHPRLFASASRWQRLQALVPLDPYLTAWNKTIFANATAFYKLPPTAYTLDGGTTGSGVLDVAREVQLRMKHWGYAYRMSNDTKWADRAWREILVASGNDTTQAFGATGNNWNTDHWLDVGEFTVAFAYAYDWFYDAWTPAQRTAIMWSIITLGLQKGVEAYATNAWFLTTNGNWNCITNGGMIIGSLAIYHEDPTGTATRLLAQALAGAQQNCANAVQSDGTWSETPDYWYFGSQGHAQLSSALLTATGSTQQMLDINPAFNQTGLFHMYVYGNTFKHNYGDCGPNKYTATANPLLFYGDQYNIPTYTLYQRDRPDAADPLSMIWYNPQASGGWYVNLPLDRNFDNAGGAWTSMRSSWTDTNGLFASIKAGNHTGHQTHGFLDAGDFVIDALGERWAGKLCHNNYLGNDYFASEGVNAVRWLYYRCRTEGQNTILYNGLNQNVDTSSPTTFGSTGDKQDNIKYTPNAKSTAFWVADLSTTYNGTSIKRGMRMLNGRTQVLIQDELANAAETSQWRMHTNATITYSNNNQVANLALNGKEMTVTVQSPAGAAFKTVQPVRLATDPPVPAGAASADLPNPGVSVLAIDIPAGTQTVQVYFTPKWTGSFTASTPNQVALSAWSLTSH